MVGYPVPLEANLNHVVQECAQPPQRACPATPIKSVDPENETVELQVLILFVRENSPGWWAVTAPTYCLGMIVEHPKFK